MVSVHLAAGTGVEPGILRSGYVFDELGSCEFTQAEALIEAAGRCCYQSWDRPNPETAATRDYIRSIVKKGHLSVLRHASATFYVSGVSTALLGQISRHKFLDLSVMSARFCNKVDSDFIDPMLLPESGNFPYYLVDDAVGDCGYAYEALAKALIAEGKTRKEAYSAARYILPQGVETRFFVTGNFQAWLEFLQKRESPHADCEIRELARQIRGHLQLLAPSIFEIAEDEEKYRKGNPVPYTSKIRIFTASKTGIREGFATNSSSSHSAITLHAAPKKPPAEGTVQEQAIAAIKNLLSGKQKKAGQISGFVFATLPEKLAYAALQLVEKYWGQFDPRDHWGYSKNWGDPSGPAYDDEDMETSRPSAQEIMNKLGKLFPEFDIEAWELFRRVDLPETGSGYDWEYEHSDWPYDVDAFMNTIRTDGTFITHDTQYD